MKQLQMTNRRRTIIECLILVVIAAVLRIWYVGKTDLGYDESFSLYMALQSLPDAIRMLCKGDNPPLGKFYCISGSSLSASLKSLSVPYHSFSAL